MELLLFSTSLDFIIAAEKAGIDSIIVDWENKDKSHRQKGYNCQINNDSPEDVCFLNENTKIPITVRINAYGPGSQAEIDSAIANGASSIMLPMARTAEEVEIFLGEVGGRVKTIIQIETFELINDIASFSLLSWDWAYIGLNDLMIAKKRKCIWEPLYDGTVERICAALKGKKYGFGGITILGGGYPISIEMLLHEYVRLNCSLGFMRKSFFNEILDRNLETEVSLIRAFIRASKHRGAMAVISDNQKLMKQLHATIRNVSDGRNSS